MRTRLGTTIQLLPVLLCVCSAAGAVDVWVDFTSDFHNGANGPPNDVADWIDELDQAADEAGVPRFNATERSEIESRIMSSLAQMFEDYEVTFLLGEPSGVHDVIYMARDNAHPDVSSTNRGSAPVDIGNQDTRGYTTVGGNPSGVPKVTTANFDSHLESSDSRARQIIEISTALAGTAGHELGHTFGLLHHYVYSTPGISPANYEDTGGVQNRHLLATGSTGLSESERETQRSLSPFSRVMLDIAGGSDASTFEENLPLRSDFIVSDRSEREGGDAGDSLGQASVLTFETGPSSGLEVSFIEADIDNSASDRDYYRFSTPVNALLHAQVFSERLDLGSDEFDPVIELINELGTVLWRIDDFGWDDDHFNDFLSPEAEEDDPFLVNIPVEPGDYYLAVSAATEDVSDQPNPGDAYWLVTALQLDEPVLAGDFNRDGMVDAADYTIWRDAAGSTVSMPYEGADGDGDRLISAADYDVWRSHFGATLGSPAPLAAPEPGYLSCAFLIVGGCFRSSRRLESSKLIRNA